MPFSDKKEFFLYDILEPMHGMFDWGDYRIGFFISRCHTKTNSDENEDCLFGVVDKQGFTIGVADGAGGHPRGRDASYQIGRTVLKDERVDLIQLMEKINKNVIDLKVGAKSTCSLAQVDGESIRFVNIGDSESILWNANGAEIYSSTPHSTTGHKIEAGLVNQEDSLDDPDRFMVDHFIGDEILKIDFASGLLFKKGQTLLIGSDGLFDNLTHQELQDFVATGQFEPQFEKLVDRCLHQESDWRKFDDLSFLVIRKVKA